MDGLTEDHTTSGIRIKSNVTRGGSVHDLVYRNICMREVAKPRLRLQSLLQRTRRTELFEDPKYKGDRIPDYKAITIQNVTSTTAGDVLIAGLNDEHRTEVTLDNVRVEGISPQQAHGHFATVTLGPGGTNINFSETDIQVVSPMTPKRVEAYSCEGKFVPMQ